MVKDPIKMSHFLWSYHIFDSPPSILLSTLLLTLDPMDYYVMYGFLLKNQDQDTGCLDIFADLFLLW